MSELSQMFWCYDDVNWEMKMNEKECDCDWRWKERNQESKTLLHISSNEGRECGSSTKQDDARLMYDCGHSDWIDGRTPSVVIPRYNSVGFVIFIS